MVLISDIAYFVDGRMADNTLGTGRIIKCMEMVNSHGQMEENILVNILKISK
jgi:hypothetical protein